MYGADLAPGVIVGEIHFHPQVCLPPAQQAPRGEISPRMDDYTPQASAMPPHVNLEGEITARAPRSPTLQTPAPILRGARRNPNSGAAPGCSLSNSGTESCRSILAGANGLSGADF